MKSPSRVTRLLVGGATAVAASFAIGLPGSLASASAPTVPTFKPGHAVYDTGVKHTVTPADAAQARASSKTFTHFQANVTVGSTTYTYVMAGRNPAVKVKQPSAKITTKLVPLVIKFSNGDTWDPTAADSCDAGASALTRTQNSPIFVSQSWTWGGTAIGNGQVTDAFQRANFWKYAQPTGINPSFGVSLSMTTLHTVTINVPNADAATASISCGNGLLGAVNIHWLDRYLQTTVIPSLVSEGVNASTLPIFLLHNVVEYVRSTSNCCVLGYHNAYKATTTSPIQTYGLSIYDNSGAFSGSSDISALSHEVGEWMDDPYTNNPTPAWGHIGQVSGCQSNLEVGDPLSGTTFTDTVGGFRYHPQELAFFSWFYHQTPSLGVKGWYSDQGKFTSFAAPCP